MPKTPSSTAPNKRAVKKAVRKTAVRKTARKTAVKKTVTKAKKPVAAKPAAPKRSRAKVLNEHPGNLVVDASDHSAVEAVRQAGSEAVRTVRVRRFTATDRAADPPAGETPAGSMVERVSSAIERELTKIERIVGNPERLAPAQRLETESRARVLASLARTLKEPTSVVTRAGTQANAYHLAPTFLRGVLARYKDTRLGRQELDGEIIEDRPDALWSRAMIENCRVAQTQPLSRIVVAVDPPASSGKRADACGIVAAGITGEGAIYVIADETVSQATPSVWAAKAIALWRRLEADALVAEVNQGGEMVRSVINEVDASVPVVSVRAHRGKFLRAEPVATLYEQGRVKHAGLFPALEDEMCDFGPGGLSSGRSPDRLDALVWAIASLTFTARAAPRVRGL